MKAAFFAMGLLLAGCASDPGLAPDESAFGELPVGVLGYVPAVSAPWDPVWVPPRSNPDAWVLVVDAQGEDVPLDVLSVGEIPYAMAGAEPLPVGEHLLATFSPAEEASWDPLELRAVEPIVVEPYGRAEGLDVEALTGRVFELTAIEIFAPSVIGVLVQEAMRPIFFQLESVDEEGARFRLLWEMETGELCQVHSDTGVLTPEGELSVFHPVFEAQTSPDPTRLHDLWFRLGFDEAGERAAGGELIGTMDLHSFGESPCNLLESIGVDCRECPDDGERSCLDFALHTGVFERVELELSEDLQPCFVALDEFPAVEIDCEPSCDQGSARGVFLPGLFGILVLMRRRRRG